LGEERDLILVDFLTLKNLEQQESQEDSLVLSLQLSTTTRAAIALELSMQSLLTEDFVFCLITSHRHYHAFINKMSASNCMLCTSSELFFFVQNIVPQFEGYNMIVQTITCLLTQESTAGTLPGTSCSSQEKTLES